MEEIQEIIDFEEKLPLRVLINRIGDVGKHWHTCSEIIWVLEGEIEIKVNGIYSLLKEDDIILINPNEIHETYSKDGVLLLIQIDAEKFGIDTKEKIYFDYNSSLFENKERFDYSKRILASLVKNVKEKSHSSNLKCRSLVYDFFSELLSQFKSDNQDVSVRSQKYVTRLHNILEYITEHYKEHLTIKDVADSEHLSVPYFSSFFEKYMGVNFSVYYSDLRLDRAVRELMTSDDSIENIALNNGYTEVHSFVRSFKKKYGTLPSIYRKDKNPKEIKSNGGINYAELKSKNYLSRIVKYLNNDKKPKDSIKTNDNIISIDPININKKGIPLRKTFTKFIGVGRAKELLYADIQEMLKKARKEIGYEFVKFHGILSDDMLVVKKKSEELVFSFILIDKVLDFLISIGMKPLIQPSFMPKDLAKNPEKTLFDNPFIVSAPKNIKEWNSLIEVFIKHIQERYGKKETESWLYCVWNEPDTSSSMFNIGNDDEFKDLYVNTFKVVKGIDANLNMGTPSVLMSYASSKLWLTDFINSIKKEGCIPDFINVHYYSDVFSESNSNDVVMFKETNRLQSDEKHFVKCIDSIKSLAGLLELSNVPIYLTEWNLTLSHRNLISDTCFKSCYLYKNVLDNMDKLDSFGYWSLTDFIEETQLPESLYHGGLGLFTYNGIPKANYYAFVLLNKIKGNILQKGDSYFISKDDDDIYIALYNYEHFNAIFAGGETFDMTPSDRYTPFIKNKSLDFSIPFTGMENGAYTIMEYSINKKFGSSFDLWVKTGASSLNLDQIESLKKISTPSFFIFNEIVDNQTFIYNGTLEPLEIRLVKIEKR